MTKRKGKYVCDAIKEYRLIKPINEPTNIKKILELSDICIVKTISIDYWQITEGLDLSPANSPIDKP